MPMTLTINRNRKTTENYNSEGFGITLAVELDQGLLDRPDELQARIADLYREADVALDQQVNGEPQQPPAQRGHDRNNGNSHRNGNGNGHTNGNGNGNGRRPQRNGRDGAGMTTAQRRAIDAIAQRLNIDAAVECHTVFGLDLARLTVREASAMIDHLKGLEEPARQNGGGR